VLASKYVFLTKSKNHWGCKPTDGSVTNRRCGKLGHRARDCYEPAPRSGCSQPGHTKETCPRTTCRHRGEKGHMKATCPRRVCRKCGQPGHIGPNCPHIWCSRCHSVGHTRETCQGKKLRCSIYRGPRHDYACQQGIKTPPGLPSKCKTPISDRALYLPLDLKTTRLKSRTVVPPRSLVVKVAKRLLNLEMDRLMASESSEGEI
jgi:hypothetical protein